MNLDFCWQLNADHDLTIKFTFILKFISDDNTQNYNLQL